MIFPEWQKDSGKAGVGQWRNGLRAWGIGRGRAGVNRARRRLYAGFGAPRNASFAKGGSRGIFRTKMTAKGVSGAENGSQRAWIRQKRVGNYEMREKREISGLDPKTGISNRK